MISKKYIFFLYFLFFFLLSFSQEEKRIDNLKNQLELQVMDTPKLEEKVNINISNTTLSNFLLAISDVHDLNINVSPQLNTIEIINNFSDVSIKNLLLFLAKEYSLDLNFTGNIISISKYENPPEIPVEKEILASYEPTTQSLSLDLENDDLDKVFRKITDISGKNMVFAPGMEEIPLSIYLNNVPVGTAMEKLAMANNLEMTQSRDGFFIFNKDQENQENSGVSKAIRLTDNFYYEVLDSINKVIKVDFENIPASDIIYSIANDLNLNVFTASSLKNIGKVSVTASNIHFDNLLEKIFQSINSQKAVEIESNRNSQTQRGNPDFSGSPTGNDQFTFKKENDIYFFGTENQLSLKEIGVVQMMHRSIEMLSNPSSNSRTRRNNRNNSFMTGTTSYYGGMGNNNNSQNFNGIGGNTNRQNNNREIGRSSSEEVSTEDIQKIIPEDILRGIELKVDSELNSFIVSGPSSRVERFKDFIQYIDKPVPVILIEVMILEVNKNAIVETGVSYGLGEEPVETQGQAFPSANMRIGAETVNRVIGGFDGFGSLNMGKVLPNFYMDIKAMETNGNLKILSTPKLSTLNGHRAHLSSGETTYYAVTSQSFFGSQIPQTSEITNYYPIDAELALDIMPFVSGDGEITLDINVIQSSFNGQRIDEDAPPGMNSREFSSIIRMRDQDVAILGGIEERTKDDSGSGVPLLARIPVIKWLFSERRREDSRKKLNILIKPTVIY